LSKACSTEWRPNSSLRAARRGESEGSDLVRIDDVGIATAFLAHDAARLITGETL
jgi:hypothetical protein